MKVNKQARRGAKELFRRCFLNGTLDENRVRQVVATVAASKPRGYLGILSHFQRLVKMEVERRTARIESATPLSQPLRAEVETRLANLYGAGLQLSFTVDPGLLGGLRVKVGSDVYDGSVEARLAALRDSF
jgi:F-type H+-transporting ATPase subunit delta